VRHGKRRPEDLAADETFDRCASKSDSPEAISCGIALESELEAHLAGERANSCEQARPSIVDWMKRRPAYGLKQAPDIVEALPQRRESSER
jgi:hypothetical protein